MMTPKQEKDRKAILSLAHTDWSKGLNIYAAHKLSDKEGGEDMVQNTYVKTWTYLAKGGKIDKMKSFLYHILNNLIVDEYRKRKHKTTSLEVLEENGFEPSAPESDNLFHHLDGKAAMLLIARLPESYRKVLKMRYVQDLSLKEMALLTGLSANTMAVQVHRGLAKLKVLYNRK